MKFWHKPVKKRVLVVGGEGFIGSYLLRTDVFEMESLDLKSGQDFSQGVPERGYSTIVFLAVDMSQTQKAFNYNQNLIKALDAYMEKHPDTQVIYTSSASVYPDSKQPQSETSFTSPSSWYGKGKLLGELYVQQYPNHTILRLANVFSGNGDGGGVIDRFVSGKRTIYGAGTAVRDYVPVERVVEVIIEAIDDPNKWRGVTNISSGRGTSVRSLWKRYGNGKPIYAKKRRGDVICSILDNTKLKKLLGEDLD